MSRIMRKTGAVMAIFMALMMSLTLLPKNSIVFAEGGKVPVTVEGTYGQTEARAMLDMVNAFRTSEGTEGAAEAWWLDPAGSGEHIAVTGLQPLVYDYALERRAMLRAAEIAVQFSHTRPDGSKAVNLAEGVNGENIAMGEGSYGTAESIFNSWLEANETTFDAQGHRVNMLGGYLVSGGKVYQGFLNTIGIGHFVYDGVDYWVQEFGEAPTGEAATDPTDAAEAVSVNVTETMINSTSMTLGTDIRMAYQEEFDLTSADITTSASITNTNLNRTHSFPVAAEYTWENLDESYLSLDGSKITAVATGEGRLRVTDTFGNSQTVPVTIDKKSIKDAIITPAVSAATYKTYVKIPFSEIEPKVTVDGRDLKMGTDYYIGWFDTAENKTMNLREPGGTLSSGSTPDIKVSFYGMNNYEGAVIDGYTIPLEPFDGLEVFTEDPTDVSLTYGETAEIAIQSTLPGNSFWDAEISVADKDILETSTKYELIGNSKCETLVITPKRAGKTTIEYRIPAKEKEYTASNTLIINVNIEPKDMTDIAQISGLGTYTWTGEPVEVEPVVRAGDDVLVKGDDYTVSYLINGEAVEAPIGNQQEKTIVTLVVTGTGNRYSGTASAEFTISPMSLTVKNIDKSYAYVKGGVKPIPKVTYEGTELTEGTDYTVTYGNNDTVGQSTGSVTVTGKGAYYYAGSKEFLFDITKSDLSRASITPEVCPQTYKTYDKIPFSEIKPEVMVDGKELEIGTDYYIRWLDTAENKTMNLKDPDGTLSSGTTPGINVSFYGINNYEGSIIDGYTIPLEPFNGLEVHTKSPENIELTYGETQEIEIYSSLPGNSFWAPEITLSDNSIVEFSIKDQVSGDSGKHQTLTIMPKKAGETTLEYRIPEKENAYTASNTLVFNITVREQAFEDVVTASFTEPDAIYKYTSPVTKFEPEVEVLLGTRKLVKDEEYTVVYEDNTYAGTAKAIVSPAGELKNFYSGSKTLEFSILPRETELVLSETESTLVYGDEKVITFSGAASASEIVTAVSGDKDAVEVTVNKKDGDSGEIIIRGTGEGTAVIAISQEADNMFSGVSGEITISSHPNQIEL